MTTEPASRARSPHWRLRTTVLEFDTLPKIMGILNVTPDSFSDGGLFVDPERAVDHALQLVEQGADILDVGGESTRPAAAPVSADEELRRVIPVITALAGKTRTPISIDTTKAVVAQAALDAGAEIVNDISGLQADAAMVPLVVAEQPGICAMHMQGTPQTMQLNPHYQDVVREVFDYLTERRDALCAAGMAPDRICLDPGIGFGKRPEHNIALLTEVAQFHQLKCPILVGHSRKSVLGAILKGGTGDRLAGTLGIALALARQGVQVIRVHDVGGVRDALRAFAAVGGLRPGGV